MNNDRENKIVLSRLFSDAFPDNWSESFKARIEINPNNYVRIYYGGCTSQRAMVDYKLKWHDFYQEDFPLGSLGNTAHAIFDSLYFVRGAIRAIDAYHGTSLQSKFDRIIADLEDDHRDLCNQILRISGYDDWDVFSLIPYLWNRHRLNMTILLRVQDLIAGAMEDPAYICQVLKKRYV